LKSFPELRQGVVHIGGKSLVLGVGIWPSKDDRGVIHIKIATGSEICTVTNDQSSVRYHRKLFYMLREILKEHDRWPYGDEGSETAPGRRVKRDR
jgi:hypothetical protein